MKYKYLDISGEIKNGYNLPPEMLRDGNERVTVFLVKPVYKHDRIIKPGQTCYKVFRVRSQVVRTEFFNDKLYNLIEPVLQGPVLLNISGPLGRATTLEHSLKIDAVFQNELDKNNANSLQYDTFQGGVSINEKGEEYYQSIIHVVPEGQAEKVYMYNALLPHRNEPKDKPSISSQSQSQALEEACLGLSARFALLARCKAERNGKDESLSQEEEKGYSTPVFHQEKPACSRQLVHQFERVINSAKRRASEMSEIPSPNADLKKPSLERKKSDDFASYVMR